MPTIHIMIKFNPTYTKTSYRGVLRPTFVQKKKQKPNGSILSNKVSALVHACEL